eukprot:SAG11_NODE_2308_length_3545_cov_2.767557_2_plen_147_part_00
MLHRASFVPFVPFVPLHEITCPWFGVAATNKKNRTWDKVVEFLENGELRRLQHKSSDPKLRAVEELKSVWGIGEKTARELIAQGFHSIMELRSERGRAALTEPQQIGLHYHEELAVRVPRKEIAEAVEIVRAEASRLPGIEAQVNI